MNTSTPPRDGGEADALVKAAEEVLRSAIINLNEHIDLLKDPASKLTETDSKKTYSRLVDAMRVFFNERQKRDTGTFGKGGAWGVEPLDLDDARDQVGRLLDRLRAHSTPRGVSGEPGAE
ncbi:MAG: hypothetical protein AAF871_06605 [Pseudomonadota bacterium]